MTMIEAAQKSANGSTQDSSEETWKPDYAIAPPKLQNLLNDDGYLNSYKSDFRYRYTQFKKSLEAIEAGEGSLLKFRYV